MLLLKNSLYSHIINKYRIFVCSASSFQERFFYSEIITTFGLHRPSIEGDRAIQGRYLKRN